MFEPDNALRFNDNFSKLRESHHRETLYQLAHDLNASVPIRCQAALCRSFLNFLHELTVAYNLEKMLHCRARGIPSSALDIINPKHLAFLISELQAYHRRDVVSEEHCSPLAYLEKFALAALGLSSHAEELIKQPSNLDASQALLLVDYTHSQTKRFNIVRLTWMLQQSGSFSSRSPLVRTLNEAFMLPLHNAVHQLALCPSLLRYSAYKGMMMGIPAPGDKGGVILGSDRLMEELFFDKPSLGLYAAVTSFTASHHQAYLDPKNISYLESRKRSHDTLIDLRITPGSSARLVSVSPFCDKPEQDECLLVGTYNKDKNHFHCLLESRGASDHPDGYGVRKYRAR